MTRYFAQLISFWLMFLLASPASAVGFSAAASPSRFELEGNTGEVVSRAFEVQHVGSNETEYVIRSNDWTLNEKDGLKFFDDLQPNSCRPWLRLERRKIKMIRGQRRRLRFELHIPKDIKPTECRLAIMIENYTEQAVSVIPNSPIKLPLSGRLGIIVYLAVGDVKPQLELVSISAGQDGKRKVPMVRIRNSGGAHGRLDGALSGVDANGQQHRYSVSTLPILAGQERSIALYPQEGPADKRKPVANVNWPVKLSGQLQWEFGNFPIEATVK